MDDYTYTLHLPLQIKFRGRFRKNQRPWNKGMKWIKAFNNGYQKGNLPKNTAPVGAKKMKDGTWFIKTGMPNKWANLNRYIWEQHHGPVAPELIVRFKPGAPHEPAIQNLICVTRAENLALNLNREKAGKSMKRRNILKKRLPEIAAIYGVKFQTLKP
jgi:hypothetical protein